jgi:hypothetical protein
MKKLILGIIAVFCLQVGFIAYNAAQRLDLAVSKTVSYPVELPNNEAPLAVSDTTPDDNDSALLARSDKPDAFRPVMAERRGVGTQLDRRPVKVVAKDPGFRPTVITIPAQKPVEFRFKNEYAALETPRSSANYDVAPAQAAPRQEKRSFLSKVIRKPYELIKALGSKLQ